MTLSTLPFLALILALPATLGATGLEDAALQIPSIVKIAGAIGSQPRLMLAAAQARGSNPRRRGWGTLKGNSNGAAFTVTINKVQGRVTGVANGSEVDLTIDDSGAYTKPFSIRYTQTLTPDTDLLESVCAENEKDRARLVSQ